MMTSKSGFAKSLEDEVKKARFSEQQIIEILKLAEAGTKVLLMGEPQVGVRLKQAMAIAAVISSPRRSHGS